MIYTHTIGRIGRDCQTINGSHGTFIAVNIAVDDYANGENITTWVRVKSSKENHLRLAQYLTKGRLILVEGTLSSSIWTDKDGENHVQLNIAADSIDFVTSGKRNASDSIEEKASKGVKSKKHKKDAPFDNSNENEKLPF